MSLIQPNKSEFVRALVDTQSNDELKSLVLGLAEEYDYLAETYHMLLDIMCCNPRLDLGEKSIEEVWQLISMFPGMKVKMLDEDMPIPGYAHPGDAGMDLRITETVTIEPQETVLVGTGIAVAIPKGFYGDVRPRSGLATKRGITLANSPGTVDSNYRGEVKLALHNHGKHAQTVERGERAAQMLITPVGEVTVIPVDDLDETSRGTGSFGSTGAR